MKWWVLVWVWVGNKHIYAYTNGIIGKRLED